jgi:Fur family iron response transcriptional regulator
MKPPLPIAFAPTALAQHRLAQDRVAQERLAQERLVQERLAQERALTGCPWHDVKAKLRGVGLRPTRQRMALGWILFAKGDRHVTAEMLYEEANRAKVPVSLATVYNTLHQFTEVGLLRQVAVDGSRAYFDTNNSMHHHFFIEDQNELLDIPASDVMVGNAPVPPEGYEIARIDVVVRLRRKQA